MVTETEAVNALRLYDAYEALPADRGGKNGPKGRARQAWIDAKNAALAKAETPAPPTTPERSDD